ncbi:MAG: Asp-tRNA(Asn)/Glu-tRNA(Gln) amidotransferase subunit GatC [Armatimonadetes bacterium]|nr:Asp-tRNA(Asn)/Glu-tRNA(Gln) amidotransferase subunit GatC [Armatimonadota bacterium]
MQLDRAQTAHVAWLARLSLTDAELERFAGQLSSILTHIQRLGELDVADIAPTAMASESDRNVTRPDEPRPASPREEILANAADVEEGSVRVRAILEETA